jgi:hypothetical protein
MDKLIKRSENIFLDEVDLLEICRCKTNLLRYEDLHKYSHIDQIFKDDACIILYQMEQDVGHFVAVTKDGDTITFFDPYGLGVDEELKFSKFNLRVHKGQIVPHMDTLIEQSGYKLVENKVRLQEVLEDISTCGRWCGMWVRMKSLGLKKFQDLFLNQEHKPDWYASALTILFSNILQPDHSDERASCL